VVDTPDDRFRPFSNFQRGRYAEWATGLGHRFPYRPGPEFFALAEMVHRDQRTLLGLDRLYSLWQAARLVARVPGNLAEIGVYRGGSSWFLSEAVRHFSGTPVPLHAFDTFTGHPSVTEHDPFHTVGRFNETSLAGVQQFLAPLHSVTIHPGDVLATIGDMPDVAYRLVHVDTDLYAPTLACLRHFAGHVSPGGVIVVDDYGARKCEGVIEAVSDAPLEHFHAWDLRTEQLLLIRIGG
jgi:hypothetical protein